MISYGGVFTADFRGTLQRDWLQAVKDRDISIEQSTNLVSFLGKPMTIQQWTMVGLPKDQNSI
jgi:hypothetical protein